MKAITIREPWASAVLEPLGGKGIENRTRGFPSSYRGVLLVHSSKVWSRRGATDPRIVALWPGLVENGEVSPDSFTLGALLGLVELTDVHPDDGCCRPWGESEYTDWDDVEHTNLVHLRLDQPMTFDEPIPCRGALGLWTPPGSLDGVIVDAVEVARSYVDEDLT